MSKTDKSTAATDKSTDTAAKAPDVSKTNEVAEQKTGPNGLPLPPKGFELVNWPQSSKIHAGKFGVIDLETLSERRAGKLVDGGFKYLKRVGEK